MIIAVPTGVKIFNWLFTMYGGRVVFATPMLWAIGFMVTFVIGGMTGVLLAVPPADFVLHNSLFLVAHFHNVIIGGVLFGAFAGYSYWFPKAFGFRLDEGLGKAAFWCWFVGFYVAFMPLYVLGLMGMTRRMQHYDVPDWHPWLLVAAVGRADHPGRHRAARSRSSSSASAQRDAAARPDRRSVGRPLAGMVDRLAAAGLQLRRAAAWSRARTPTGRQRRRAGRAGARSRPTRTSRCRGTAPTGFVCAFFATFMGFALIWHIWWLVAVGCVGAFATFVVFAWRDVTRTRFPAAEVARIDRANRARRAALAPMQPRRSGMSRCPRRIAGTLRARRTSGSGVASASSSATASGSSCSATSSCSRRFFADLRGAVRRDRRRPERHGAVRPAQRRDRDRLPAAVELHLRHGQHRRAGPRNNAMVLWRAWRRPCVLGAVVPRAGAATSSPAWSAQGAGPTRSAFLSAFFTLVGCHGLHVTLGLLWLLTMMAQVLRQGLPRRHPAPVLCFSLFWHALDIIWVAIFTVVYLMGAAR